MTPENSRWEEFTSRLGSPEGCDFQERGGWVCSSKMDRPFATAILEKMGNIDIEQTMEYFNNHGGFCDCEILFNVDE